jgi:hypothetical protein
MPDNFNLEDDDDELLYRNVPMAMDDEEVAPVPFGPQNNPALPPMPNVPRDPNDPKQKLKEYFQKQDQLNRDNQGADRRDMEQYRKSNSEIGLAQLFNQAANQFGTLGGKAASSAPFDQFSQGLKQNNALELQMARSGRTADAATEDRKLKMAEYLQRQGFQTQAANDRREAAQNANNRGERSLKIQEQNAQTKANQPPKPTMGMQRRDTDYAKDYNDWVGNGRSTAEKNLTLLKSAQKKLATLGDDSWVSGKVVGNMPSMLRTDESRTLEQDVKQAASGALKATLGAAFGQREGENIQKMSYDPTLSPAANAKKIELAIREIESAVSVAEARAQYFEQHDTLQGWKDPRAAVSVSDSADRKAEEFNTSASPAATPSKPIHQMTREEKLKELEALGG